MGETYPPLPTGGESPPRASPPPPLPSDSQLPVLLTRREVCPPVLLVAGFVGIRALRPFLAVADRLQPVRRHAQRLQELLGRCRAPVAQAEVVFGRAAFVAVAFHHDDGRGEIGQDCL